MDRERGVYFDNGAGGKIHISQQDMHLINDIRQLRVKTKIALLALSPEDIENYLSEQKKELLNRLMPSLVEKNWRWRDTGDTVIWSDILILDKISRAALLRKARSKAGLSFEELKAYLEWFEGDRAEIYIAEI
ncbi:hypothetical protein ABDK00_017075 [Niabella insulamsoli]|uniref:hypothetical protein n=1 Tax=Niabella insulamsoli TaxID=3144874 RepID=UPI0031FC5AD4